MDMKNSVEMGTRSFLAWLRRLLPVSRARYEAALDDATGWEDSFYVVSKELLIVEGRLAGLEAALAALQNQVAYYEGRCDD